MEGREPMGSSLEHPFVHSSCTRALSGQRNYSLIDEYRNPPEMKTP
jgi:hypothetical protein